MIDSVRPSPAEINDAAILARSRRVQSHQKLVRLGRRRRGVYRNLPGTDDCRCRRWCQHNTNISVTVTVGDTAAAGSIEIRNANTDPNTADVNTVCNFGDPFPCPPNDQGITLIPSCGKLGAFSVCDPDGADPDVFVITGTPSGSVGTECAGMLFDFALIDPIFGQYRFTPKAVST